jgi:hypothetical protein
MKRSGNATLIVSASGEKAFQFARDFIESFLGKEMAAIQGLAARYDLLALEAAL